MRSLPQRNAFHMFTVDRHLLQTVANAAELMRDVSRPDLLLVAALLHDIGKGYGGDHTEVGIRLVRRMLPRMGFSAADSEIWPRIPDALVGTATWNVVPVEPPA